MRIMAIAAALAVVAGAAAAQDAGGQVIRMGTEGAYPPYSFINDQGELAGFEIDLGNELCARAQLSCTWVRNDWDSIIPNLVSGNYDTIMAGMSITPERDAVIDFSQDYIPPTPSSYVGLSPDTDVSTGTVAAQTSTMQSSYVADSGATLLEYATQDESIAAVRAGEADAVFGDTDYLTPVVEASGGELSFIGEPVPLGGGIGIGLRESDTELKDKLNATLTEMKGDGSLNALLQKWFGEAAPQY